MELLLLLAALVLTGCATVPSDKTATAEAEVTAVRPAPVISYPATNPDTWEPGAGWTLAWSDEFSGDSLDENVWTRQKLMFPYNNEYEQYTGKPETAYVTDGCMVIKAEQTKPGIVRTGFSSARVISNPGGQDGKSSAEGKTFQYGKIAARIQLPYGKGLWPAFWLLGDDTNETGGTVGWPVCGEIDIMEGGSNAAPGNGDGTVTGALHHDPSPGNKVKQNQFLMAGKKTLPGGELYAEGFHVFEIEWDAEKIVWKMDGEKWGEVSIDEETRDEFHKPYYALFNVAVAGGYTHTPDETTVFPQYMYVDWIREYRKD